MSIAGKALGFLRQSVRQVVDAEEKILKDISSISPSVNTPTIKKR